MLIHSPPYLPTSTHEVCDPADEELSVRVYKKYVILMTVEQHKICTK